MTFGITNSLMRNEDVNERRELVIRKI